MTENEQKTLLELEQQFSRLSSDIDMISSTAAYLEGEADDFRATLHDLCYKLKISYEWTEK